MIEALEIKTSRLFNFFLLTILLSCLFFFFLSIDSCFLFPAHIAQILFPTAELVNPIRKPTKEATEKIETNLVIAEAKISKCSI